MTEAARRALGPLSDKLLSLVGDGVISTDASGVIVLVNKAAEEIFGYEAEELLGEKIEILLPGRFRASHRNQVQEFGRSSSEAKRAMAHGRNVLGLRKDGDEFPVEAILTRYSFEGRRLLTVVLRDISERRRIEENQRLVTAEISHRLKNLVAVVHSIVSLTARGAESVNSYEALLKERLKSIDRTIDLMLRSHWSGADLTDLLELEFAPFRDRLGANYVLCGPEVKVPARWAISLTLALHELATNAAKFGALSTPKGTVKVDWQVDQAATDPVLRLSWVESGGPPVEKFERQGFGSDLIFRALGPANTRLERNPGGLEAHLQMAL